ncbi:lytic murein transglycosylase [Streptomonospora sp. S1-112]|uniref:Lytic murein transglycosylase n=1 Tax=Streptomonospora mangrovi TaxID=2883123 RepID=A0A9X3NRL3_9ACTN|nr:lytic murein transglycosylase [Streptomonospora mangrovi]MDA0565520.1 lytic murein transglycosylase [Streptomonospora mangrovi]
MSGPPTTGPEAPPASSTPSSARPARWRPAVAALAAVVATVGVAAGVAGAVGALEPGAPPALPPGAGEAAGSIDTVPATDASASGGPELSADDRPSPDPAPTAADPSPEWLATVSEATGVPERALEAYARAQLRLSAEKPRCMVSWPTLAGIGEIESVHGTILGGEIGPDGRTTEEIIGIPLDGDNNTRVIHDTDNGDYDHDTEWDRAVGPMQFIPTTWGRWGADADDVGGADPHDIDDAALAAARYLCSKDRVLTTDSGWWEAILDYNESRTYGEDVLAAADRYADDAAEALG